MFKAVLVDKVNTFLESEKYMSRIGTVITGMTDSHIAKENVFVLSDKVQVNEDGKLIEEEEQEFVFVPCMEQTELSVETPFAINALKESIELARHVLKHNFHACLFTLGCVSMGIHADLIRELDGCPITILVGKSGRGKTYSLQLGMAAVGMLKHCTKMTSKAALLKASSNSSMGVYVDDPKSLDSISDLFVDFYSGTSKSTIARGVEKVRSALFLTSNEVSQSTAREARRIVYVPFSGETIRGVTPREISHHILFKKQVRSGSLSSALGKIISMRKEFSSVGKITITEELVPFVAEHLQGAIPDVILSYATALWFTHEICAALSCCFDTVKQYFITTVAPFAVQYQNQRLEKEQLESVDVLQEFATDLVKFCQGSQETEVKSIVSTGQTDNRPSLIVHPSFFDDKHYSSTSVISLLKMSRRGKSQCRSFLGKQLRKVIVHQSLFEKNGLDTILKVIQNDNGANGLEKGQNSEESEETSTDSSSEDGRSNSCSESDSEHSSTTVVSIVTTGQKNNKASDDDNDDGASDNSADYDDLRDDEDDDKNEDERDNKADDKRDDKKDDEADNKRDNNEEDNKRKRRKSSSHKQTENGISQGKEKRLKKRANPDSLTDALTPHELPEKRPRKLLKSYR